MRLALPLALALTAAAPAAAGFRVLPYVQNPAPDGITILWLAEGGSPGAVTVAAAGEPITLASTAERADALRHHPRERRRKGEPLPEPPWLHRVRVTGLEPGGRYDYTVAHAGATHTASFRTAPAGDAPVRFVVYADCETEPESTGKRGAWPAPGGRAPERRYPVDQTEGYRQNLALIARYEPDFIAIAGDLVESGGEQRDWDEFWRHNAGELGQIASSVPILPAIGNHENYGGPGRFDGYGTGGNRRAVGKYQTYFETPDNGAENPAARDRYWRLDYGPVTLISIDSANGRPEDGDRDTNFHLRADASAGVDDFNPGSAQYAWLERELAAAQRRSRFTFVEFHHLPYSEGVHGLHPGTGAGKYGWDPQSGIPLQALTPLFLRYGVDAVFCGHDEMYERSVVRGREVTPDGAERPHAIQFYDVGIGGDDLRGPVRGDDGKYDLTSHPWLVYLAHRDSSEVWDGRVLRAGGKHYGHLEVEVRPGDDGHWRAVLTPVHLFPLMDRLGGVTGWERRVYDDEVILSDDPMALPVSSGAAARERAGAQYDALIAAGERRAAGGRATLATKLRIAGAILLAITAIAIVATGLGKHPRRRRPRTRLGLYLGVAALLWWWLPASPFGIPPPAIAEFQDLRKLGGWLGEVSLTLVCYLALAVPIGYLARRGFSVRSKSAGKRTAGTVAAVAVTLLATLFLAGLSLRPPALWGAFVPLVPSWIGAAVGLWLGGAGEKRRAARGASAKNAAAKGPPTSGALAPRLLAVAALAAVALVVGALALFVATDSAPWEIEIAENTVEHKRELRELMSGKNPKRLAPGMTRRLELTQEDLDRMVAWGLALDGQGDRLARLELAEDRMTVHSSLRLPIPAVDRYLNMSFGGETAIDDGHLYLRGETLRVGRIELPSFLLGLASRVLVAIVQSDERAQTLLQPVRRLRITQQTVQMSYGRLEIGKGFIGDILRGEGLLPQLVPSIRAQVEELAHREMAPGTDRFAFALETAFAVAAERSASGDPVAENKAALLALGMMLGHWRIESMVGRVLEEELRQAGLDRYNGTQIRGRHDWTRHYTVSAALVVLAAEGVSSAVGLLKEELDAQGGSGFSFTDLLADEAGTKFASLAIRDPAAARATQARLAAGFAVDDYFPPAADLPEGLQDTDFEAEFGGVGGARYEEIVGEIQRRIAGCAAYAAYGG